MSKAQMKKDIKLWSTEKLYQWMKDSNMRYKLIGLDHEEAMIETCHLLMVVAAGMLGTQTNASVADCTIRFAELIVSIRTQEGLDVNLGHMEIGDEEA